ncbi:MAG: non-canonical purine NTP pyrophosphatase [Chloroflexi bacterium]|nr:non-canonical purine NTP pyrophosphatase [Chloroflexota bacterium]
MRQLLYATTNPGKLMELGRIMARQGLSMVSPAEIGIVIDVAEDGATLEENARLKARAYLDRLADSPAADRYVVLADDTGLEIDALGGQPGIHARRWKNGQRMEDEELITYCLQQMAHIPPGQREAQFRTVFALGVPGAPLELFDGTLRGELLEQPDPLRIEGFPFESIFYVPEWGSLLGKVHELPAEQKARLMTHRDRAMETALPRLRALLGEK